MKLKLLILLFAFAPFIANAQSAPTLVWTANPPGDLVTGYNVYEHVGTAYNLLTPAPITIVSYSLTGVPVGTHVYAVTAVNIRGESLKSSEVTFPATPTAPLGLKINP